MDCLADKKPIKILLALSSAAAFVVLLSSLVVWWSWQAPDASDLVLEVKTARVEINNHVIWADLALEPAEQYRGLSGREYLCADCGLLFVFPDSAPRSFVMREMNFPLDIIFINDGRIINIEAEAQPEGIDPENFYLSAGSADMVLEVPAGTSHTQAWEPGLLVQINYED